jgi:hypothetical protein
MTQGPRGMIGFAIPRDPMLEKRAVVSPDRSDRLRPSAERPFKSCLDTLLSLLD